MMKDPSSAVKSNYSTFAINMALLFINKHYYYFNSCFTYKLSWWTKKIETIDIDCGILNFTGLGIIWIEDATGTQ